MSSDSGGGSNKPDDEADATGKSKTLLGGSVSKEVTPQKPSAPAEHSAARKAKGKQTIPGGSPQRGEFWGRVSTKPGMGTDKIDIEALSRDPLVEVERKITEELNLSEIQDVDAPPPPPKRKPSMPAPPIRRPPLPKRPEPDRPVSRPPPPKREALREPRVSPVPPVAVDSSPTSQPPPAKESGDRLPHSRPAPPRRPGRSEPPPVPATTTPSVAIPKTPALPAVVEMPIDIPMPTPALNLRSINDVCEAELKLQPDAARAARLHFEMGQSTTDPRAALRSYRQALEKAPDHLPSIRQARVLELIQKNVVAAAELFDAEIRLTHDERDRALLFYQKGCAWLDVAGEPEAARSCFSEAARLDPGHPTILKAMEHAELVAKDWARLSDALVHEANAIFDDPRHRAAIVTKRARLLERRLRKPEEAIEQYELALGFDLQTPTALAELKRLLFGQSRWTELVQALEREASLTRDAQVRANAFWAIARVQSERLGNKRDALEALEKAAEISPRDPLLLEELSRLYIEAGDDKGAASALERLSEAMDAPAERLSALHRLGELYERLGKPQEAVRWYEATLAVDGGYAPALHALDTLYKSTENWAALARMYVTEASAASGSKRRAAAYARAADIFDTRLARPDDAVLHYGHALALDPYQEGAFKALVRLHTARQRHKELIELYDRAIDAAPSEDLAIAYLFKMAGLYEDVLRDVASAASVFQRVLKRQPNNLGAIHGLQRTAEASGLYRELVDALDREAKLENARERLVMLQHRAADVLAEQLGQPDAALERFAAILKRDVRHAPTLTSLERLHQAAGRTAELLGVHEKQLDVLDPGPARVALLLRMAELCERQLGNIDAAIGWYRRAVAEDPKHALARASLIRLLRTKGDFKELAQVLTAELVNVTDRESHARIALLLGEVHEVHLARPVDAVVAYRRAIDAMPGYPAAIDGLARVHSAGSAWKELADTLQLESQSVRDPRLALDATLRAAALRTDRLGRDDDAAAALSTVVHDDPHCLAALITLEPLHVAADRNRELMDLYAKQAEVLGHAGARVAALVERARLIEKSPGAEGFDVPRELRAACTAILAADPGNAWALAALERVALITADRGLLSDVDARYTDSLDDTSVLSFHFTRLGESLTHTNPAGAQNAYRTAIKHSPDNLTAIRGLAAVGAAMGDAPTMVEAYRREAAFTRDDKSGADLYVQSASVLARLGDRTAAIEDAERALVRSPDHVHAAEMLSALLGQGTLVDRLIEQLSRAAHSAKEPPRKVELWRQVAGLYADRKQDLGAAQSAVRRALDCDDKHVDSILQLAELHRRNAQHEEAAQFLERAVAINEGLVSAQLELARIYTDHLPDTDKARKAIDRVLRAEPQHRDALRMLLKLQIGTGDRDKARATSGRLLEAAGDDAEMRSWALVEIARVELAAGDTDSAAEALHEAVVMKGIDGDAAKLYRKLAMEKIGWERYAKALRAYLDQSGDKSPRRLARVYLDLARTQHSRLRQSPQAFRTLEEALGRVGDSPDLILEQAELFASTGRQQEASIAFLSLIGRDPFQTEAWRGLTSVLQQQGRKVDATLAAAPLVLLGVATDVERNLSSERAVRPGMARPNAFGRVTMRALSAGNPDEDERVAAVFAVVADGLAKAFPVPYEQYGVRKGDRIKARTPHPMRAEIDRLCGIFAIEEVELYMTAALGGDVTVELSQPPAIMVPSYVSDLPDPQRVFLLARPLAALAAGTSAAFKLTPEEVALTLAAAVRRLVPGFEDEHHDRDRLVALTDKLAPSWFGRGKVDEAVQRYYADPVDASVWAPTVAHTASRAAALLAGDLEACVTAMRYAGLIPGGGSIEELARRSPIVEDILRFWMSEKGLEVRRIAGLL